MLLFFVVVVVVVAVVVFICFCVAHVEKNSVLVLKSEVNSPLSSSSISRVIGEAYSKR